MTQTDRIPASAAARQATGTTSETCLSWQQKQIRQALFILNMWFKAKESPAWVFDIR